MKANTLDDAQLHNQNHKRHCGERSDILGSDAEGGTRFLGSICLWKISREDATAEIGFELLPENHGKGIMQEVIPEVIQFGFEETKLQTIEAEVSPRNLKSVRLLEKNNFKLAEVNESLIGSVCAEEVTEKSERTSHALISYQRWFVLSSCLQVVNPSLRARVDSLLVDRPQAFFF